MKIKVIDVRNVSTTNTLQTRMTRCIIDQIEAVIPHDYRKVDHVTCQRL